MAVSPTFNQRPASEETINNPTNPRHYWCYRIHVKIEELLANKQFMDNIKVLLEGEDPCCGGVPRSRSPQGCADHQLAEYNQDWLQCS